MEGAFRESTISYLSIFAAPGVVTRLLLISRDGKWLDKSKVSPFTEETISGHIKFDVFADAYKKTDDWSKKREAHDKLVQTGKKKASDAPELYKWDRWKGKFACLLCRKTGHTQNHERCPA